MKLLSENGLMDGTFIARYLTLEISGMAKIQHMWSTESATLTVRFIFMVLPEIKMWKAGIPSVFPIRLWGLPLRRYLYRQMTQGCSCITRLTLGIILLW